MVVVQIVVRRWAISVVWLSMDGHYYICVVTIHLGVIWGRAC